MENTSFDLFSRAGLEQWLASEQEDNALRLERLHRNLPLAIAALTPRQQEVVELYFYRRMGISAIAASLGVNKSSVSRTLRRARTHLGERLRFSL